MRIVNLLVASVVTIAAAIPAIADEATIARCPMGPGHGRMHGECDKFSRLDLTDEQNEKLYQLKEKFADQIGTTKVEIKKERRKMRDLLTQPTIDRKAVEIMQGKISSLKTSLCNAKLSFKLDASEILTAEQRKQLRYGSFGSSWGKPGTKVSDSDTEFTLLSLLPSDIDSDMDSDLN